MRKITTIIVIVLLLALLFTVYGVPHAYPGAIKIAPGVTIPPNFSGNYSKENYTLLLTNFKTLYSDVNQSVISFSHALTVALVRGLTYGILAGLFFGVILGAILEGGKRKNKPT
jgi:hypothetical protein